MQLIIVVINVIFLSKCVLSDQILGTRSVPSLKFIVVVSKHGARGPTHTYPRDPFKDRSMWPDGPGQITKIGKQQMHRVGKKLRLMYDGFLSDIYKRNQILAQSTLVERTMLSAATLLAGLYPPQGFQLWNSDIHWQPIPIYPNLLDKSLISLDPTHCPRYVKEQNRSLENLRDENRKYSDIYKEISAGTGRNLTSCSQMYLLCNNFAAVVENDLPLADWAAAVFLPRLLPLVSRIVKTTTLGNVKMVKILNGLFLGKMLELFTWRAKPSVKDDLSVFLHVGHDITLLCLLSAIGFNEEKIPWASTTLVFELHANPDLLSKHEIKVVKIDGRANSSSTPELLDMPVCKNPCDFQTFIAQTKKYTTVDWEKECQDMTSPSDQ